MTAIPHSDEPRFNQLLGNFVETIEGMGIGESVWNTDDETD